MKTNTFFIILIVISAIFLSLSRPVQTATGSEPAAVNGLSISGRVVDSQGNGLYGVTVLLIKTGDFNFVFLPLITNNNTLQRTSEREDDPSTFTIKSRKDVLQVRTLTIPDYSTFTVEDGFYQFNDIPGGFYILEVLGQGFNPGLQELVVLGDVNVLNIVYEGVIPTDMVFVPEGEFLMGCDPDLNADFECGIDEVPQHEVYLDAYIIDRKEVTNAQYALCVAAGECAAPSDNSSATRSSYFNSYTYFNYPVIHITWNNARDYCTFAGKNLPTEAQWEKAARGVSNNVFPWGDFNPTCTLANSYNDETLSNCAGDTNTVGSYPDGQSAYGAMDLAGNVWEWVNDWYSATYYTISPTTNPIGPIDGINKVIRGASWRNPWFYLRASHRSSRTPEFSDYDTGFRCAAPAP